MMNSAFKTKEELIRELEGLRARVSELEKDKRNSRQVPGNIEQRMDQSFPLVAHRYESIFVVFEKKLEFINERFADLFRISPEEACSPDFDPMTLIAPESRRVIGKSYRDGCHGAFKTKQFNFTGLSKDGLKIECQTFIVFIPYKWGTAVQGTLRSISLHGASQKHYSEFPLLNDVPMAEILRADRDHLFPTLMERPMHHL